jgi:two-component system, NarL family, response regulator FusR
MTLMVDDDPIFLEDAKAILNLEEGVFFARNGRDALWFLQVIDFSVAMVDLDLHDESGFDVIRNIRAACPMLPIIAISGVDPRAVLESAKISGAEEVLQKPATPEWKPVVERLRQSSLARRAGHN